MKYYDFIGNFENGLAIVMSKSKFGVVDSFFIEFIPCIYTHSEMKILLNKYKLNKLRKSKLKFIL